MAEYSAIAVQTVNPGESIVFTETTSPCWRGLVRHSDGSGNFLLSGSTNGNGCCPCSRMYSDSVAYLVDFGANIAIPTDGTPAGTPGEISVAFAIDGGTDQASIMRVTPAALGEYFNVSRSKEVDIFSNCCQTVTIRNTSDQPILVQNATLRITRPDYQYGR